MTDTLSFTSNGVKYIPTPRTVNPMTYADPFPNTCWNYYLYYVEEGSVDISYKAPTQNTLLYCVFVSQGGSSGKAGNIIIDNSADNKNFRCSPSTPGTGGSGDISYQTFTGNTNIKFTTYNIGSEQNSQIIINDSETPITIRCGLNGTSGKDLNITNGIPSGGAGGDAGDGGGVGGAGGTGSYATYIGPFPGTYAPNPNPYNGGTGRSGKGYSDGVENAALDGVPISYGTVKQLPVKLYDGSGTGYIAPTNCAQVFMYYQIS